LLEAVLTTVAGVFANDDFVNFANVNKL